MSAVAIETVVAVMLVFLFRWQSRPSADGAVLVTQARYVAPRLAASWRDDTQLLMLGPGMLRYALQLATERARTCREIASMAHLAEKLVPGFALRMRLTGARFERLTRVGPKLTEAQATQVLVQLSGLQDEALEALEELIGRTGGRE